MKRRTFLSAGAGAAILATARAGSGTLSHPAGTAKQDLRGRILAVGFDGGRHGRAERDGGASVFTEVDLASGAILRQDLVPVPNLHLAVHLPRTGSLLLPLDGPTAILAPFDRGAPRPLPAPVGYWFSGHGLVDATGSRLYVSLRRQEAKSKEDVGAILVLELPDLQQVGLMNSGGVRPHDLAWESRESLIVSHYGDLAPGRKGDAPPPRIPCLTTLNVRTGKVLRRIDTPAEGALTHIAYDGERLVCGVPLHYFSFDDSGRAKLKAALAGRDAAIAPAERWENRLAMPLAPLLIDLKNGNITALPADVERQRRAQSVLFDPGSRSFWITYAFSDVVARIDVETRAVSYLDGFDLGLTSVRGLCALSDNEHIVVSGELCGLAVVHARTMTVVRRIKAPLFDNPHLTFVTETVG